MKQDVRAALISHYLNQAGRVDAKAPEYGRRPRRVERDEIENNGKRIIAVGRRMRDGKNNVATVGDRE